MERACGRELTSPASLVLPLSQERPYPHAIVAGVDRYPRKVTKGMGKKRIEKRSKVRPSSTAAAARSATRASSSLSSRPRLPSFPSTSPALAAPAKLHHTHLSTRQLAASDCAALPHPFSLPPAPHHHDTLPPTSRSSPSSR